MQPLSVLPNPTWARERERERLMSSARAYRAVTFTVDKRRLCGCRCPPNNLCVTHDTDVDMSANT